MQGKETQGRRNRSRPLASPPRSILSSTTSELTDGRRVESAGERGKFGWHVIAPIEMSGELQVNQWTCVPDAVPRRNFNDLACLCMTGRKRARIARRQIKYNNNKNCFKQSPISVLTKLYEDWKNGKIISINSNVCTLNQLNAQNICHKNNCALLKIE